MGANAEASGSGETVAPEAASPAGANKAPSAASERERSRRGLDWGGRVAWLGANLLVVFVGVYGAFLFDRLGEEQRDRRRMRAFELALAREFATTADSLVSEGRNLTVEFAQPFLAALEAGERPRPRPLPFAVGELDNGTWRALMTAGGIELLEPDTIIEVDHFYATLRSLVGNLERFERLADRYLIPTLESPIEHFYDERGELRPSWRWYEETLRHLPNQLENLESWARSLAERFGAGA